jgi:hypothetical protein
MNLQVGQWIRKANYTIIHPIKGRSKPKRGKEYWGTPVMKIERLGKDKSLTVINGRAFPRTAQFVVIEEQEAISLLKAWDECQISETTMPLEITSCVREDTGEPKNKIHSPESARELLFGFKMKYPDKEFNAYKCAHCETYHVGKRKETPMTKEQILEMIESIEERLKMKEEAWNAILHKKKIDDTENFDVAESWWNWQKFIEEEDRQLGILNRQLRMIDDYTLTDIPDYGHVMQISKFIESCRSGGFIDYDGNGNYIEGDKMTSINIYPSDVKHGAIRPGFDKIVWFNR